MPIERFSDEDILKHGRCAEPAPTSCFGLPYAVRAILMHSSMKFMLLSVFLDYSCSNSTCNLPGKNINIFSIWKIVELILCVAAIDILSWLINLPLLRDYLINMKLLWYM